jgi:orotate phosphoribosyltransferase-like protein
LTKSPNIAEALAQISPAYEPSICKKVVEYGSQGMGKTEIAAELKVSTQTLDMWLFKHPEFANAMNLSNTYCQAWWEKIGRLGTVGKIKDFNPSLYTQMQKHLFGRKSK